MKKEQKNLAYVNERGNRICPECFKEMKAK